MARIYACRGPRDPQTRSIRSCPAPQGRVLAASRVRGPACGQASPSPQWAGRPYTVLSLLVWRCLWLCFPCTHAHVHTHTHSTGLLILDIAWKYTSQRTESNLTRCAFPTPTLLLFFCVPVFRLLACMYFFPKTKSWPCTELGVGLVTPSAHTGEEGTGSPPWAVTLAGVPVTGSCCLLPRAGNMRPEALERQSPWMKYDV